MFYAHETTVYQNVMYTTEVDRYKWHETVVRNEMLVKRRLVRLKRTKSGTENNWNKKRIRRIIKNVNEKRWKMHK